MAISKGFRYKDKEGKVTDYEYGVNGSNVTQDSEHRLVTDEEKQTWNDKADLEDIPSGSAASHAVANNCTTTQAGSVLDARQGKVLMDKANQLSSDFAKVIRFDSEGTNIDITSPDGVQWEIDAYNNNLRFYSVDTGGILRSVTMTTEGDIADSYGNTMRGLQQSFQNGCNAIYQACINNGVTPSSNSPDAIVAAIEKISSNVVAEFCSRKTSMDASETLTGSGLVGDIYILFSTGATTGTSLNVTGGSVIHSSNAGYSGNNGAIWTIRSTAENISVTIKADDKTLMRLTRQ